MAFRIYIDESGTHSDAWLVIGMLFVPNHGPLHSDLCKVKEDHAYFNASPKHSSRYKETHLTNFRSPRDVTVGKAWIDVFIRQDCYFRCVVVDWSLWDGSYFGNAFDPEALEKRRAYKKWAEMLLHPELKQPASGRQIVNARLFLDRLRIMYGYDVLDWLKERFTQNYKGDSPYIEEFQHTDSWRDANQCLQLADLLTGCMYQSLVPSPKAEKKEVRDYLEGMLKPFAIDELTPKFWRHFAQTTLNQRFPKFSAWFWRPSEEGKRKKKGKRGK